MDTKELEFRHLNLFNNMVGIIGSACYSNNAVMQSE